MSTVSPASSSLHVHFHLEDPVRNPYKLPFQQQLYASNEMVQVNQSTTEKQSGRPFLKSILKKSNFSREVTSEDVQYHISIYNSSNSRPSSSRSPSVQSLEFVVHKHAMPSNSPPAVFGADRAAITSVQSTQQSTLLAAASTAAASAAVSISASISPASTPAAFSGSKHISGHTTQLAAATHVVPVPLPVRGSLMPQAAPATRELVLAVHLRHLRKSRGLPTWKAPASVRDTEPVPVPVSVPESTIVEAEGEIHVHGFVSNDVASSSASSSSPFRRSRAVSPAPAVSEAPVAPDHTRSSTYDDFTVVQCEEPVRSSRDDLGTASDVHSYVVNHTPPVIAPIVPAISVISERARDAEHRVVEKHGSQLSNTEDLPLFLEEVEQGFDSSPRAEPTFASPEAQVEAQIQVEKQTPATLSTSLSHEHQDQEPAQNVVDVDISTHERRTPIATTVPTPVPQEEAADVTIQNPSKQKDLSVAVAGRDIRPRLLPQPQPESPAVALGASISVTTAAATAASEGFGAERATSEGLSSPLGSVVDGIDAVKFWGGLFGPEPQDDNSASVAVAVAVAAVQHPSTSLSRPGKSRRLDVGLEGHSGSSSKSLQLKRPRLSRVREKSLNGDSGAGSGSSRAGGKFGDDVDMNVESDGSDDEDYWDSPLRPLKPAKRPRFRSAAQSLVHPWVEAIDAYLDVTTSGQVSRVDVGGNSNDTGGSGSGSGSGSSAGSAGPSGSGVHADTAADPYKGFGCPMRTWRAFQEAILEVYSAKANLGRDVIRETRLLASIKRLAESESDASWNDERLEMRDKAKAIFSCWRERFRPSGQPGQPERMHRRASRSRD